MDLERNDQAFRARSKPVVVSVRFATEEGVVETLEGPVNHQPGDAIVTGVTEEKWPVSRERFLSKYTALPPTSQGEDGRYTKRREVVIAYQLMNPHTVTLTGGRGELRGRTGDYLVQYATGDQAIVEAKIFDLTYERCVALDN